MPVTAEVEDSPPLLDWNTMQWRTDALEKAGWPIKVAVKIAADPSIDLHLACELLEKGCPPALALKIIY